MTAREILTVILALLVVANFLIGNVAVGFALAAIVIANGSLSVRDRRGERR
jgi:hypothetical protein